MSLLEHVMDLLGGLAFSLSTVPWEARCPVCRGDLRWVSFFSRERRIRCVDCEREWVKDGRGRWELDYPHNPT